MSNAVDIESLKRLSTTEKFKVIAALWDSIDERSDPDAPEDVIAEMERRLDWGIANPDKCGDYNDFKARIRTNR